MKFENAWSAQKDKPLKPELSQQERRDLIKASETFNDLINLLPQKTPDDLKSEQDYLESLQKMKEIAQELEYYSKMEG